MPGATRQGLTEAAVRRFYRDGFRNVGLDQILDDVGISKTAFYKHFDSKEGLMLEALLAQDQWLQRHLAELLAISGPSPRQQLYGLFDALEKLRSEIHPF